MITDTEQNSTLNCLEQKGHAKEKFGTLSYKNDVWTKEVMLRSRREWLGQRRSLKQKGYSQDRKVVLKQRVEKRG